MGTKIYEKRISVQAIQFQGLDQAHINEIIAFVGMPISVDFGTYGVKLRIIRSNFDVIEAYQGDYLVKDAAGVLRRMDKKSFEAEYQEVTP
ncbi:hypothetical protein [Paenibacillus solani]|uniref:hypothetical protein n=1 Tax=Paenibacillus solani TaxID=1705565 RepID=UPI003D2BBE38